MSYRSAPPLRALLLILTVLSVGCRGVAGYQGVPGADGRVDTAVALDGAHRDATVKTDTIATDQGPPPVGDCGGWWLQPPAELAVGVGTGPALLALPQGGWLVAWTQGDVVYTRSIDAAGQPVATCDAACSAAPRAQDLALHQTGAGPLVAWSERLDAASSTDCRRRIGLKVLGPSPVFYYEEATQSLDKPSLTRAGDDVHLVVSRNWITSCGGQPHRKLMHGSIASNGDGSYGVQLDTNYLLGSETSTFGPVLVHSRAPSYGSSGGFAVLRLFSPDAEALAAPTWQLQLYRASVGGNLALEPMVVVGDVPASSTFSVLDDGQRLWIARSTPAGQVEVAWAAGASSSPTTHTRLDGGRPALFYLQSPVGVHGLVLIDGQGLQLRRLGEPAGPPINPTMTTLRPGAIGLYQPVAATQPGALAVVWAEDVGPTTRLVLRVARCRDSTTPSP